MPRYLIIKHWLKETYFTDNIEKKDLLELKEKTIEMIIDLENSTFFNADENKWETIKTI